MTLHFQTMVAVSRQWRVAGKKEINMLEDENIYNLFRSKSAMWLLLDDRKRALRVV